jgi:hypothetical protein
MILEMNGDERIMKSSKEEADRRKINNILNSVKFVSGLFYI